MTEQCNTNISELKQECSCGCGAKHAPRDIEGSCCCAEKFLEIADEAWREVLKEKIKAKIIAKKGEHLDRLADLVATINGEKWKHKISARLKCDDYKDKLKEFFSTSCD